MYTEFLKVLSELSEGLDKLAKLGGGGEMTTPYLGGTVDVLLDGEKVGHFRFEDDWVIYEEAK